MSQRSNEGLYLTWGIGVISVSSITPWEKFTSGILNICFYKKNPKTNNISHVISGYSEEEFRENIEMQCKN